jgi:hypothetical protein
LRDTLPATRVPIGRPPRYARGIVLVRHRADDKDARLHTDRSLDLLLNRGPVIRQLCGVDFKFRRPVHIA